MYDIFKIFFDTVDVMFKYLLSPNQDNCSEQPAAQQELLPLLSRHGAKFPTNQFVQQVNRQVTMDSMLLQYCGAILCQHFCLEPQAKLCLCRAKY